MGGSTPPDKDICPVLRNALQRNQERFRPCKCQKSEYDIAFFIFLSSIFLSLSRDVDIALLWLLTAALSATQSLMNYR